jgi:hypothetical protein
MQSIFPNTKGIRKRIFGLYCFVLAVIALASHAASLDPAVAGLKEPYCSVKDKKAKTGFDVNEMLFSIKSLSLYDLEAEIIHND